LCNRRSDTRVMSKTAQDGYPGSFAERKHYACVSLFSVPCHTRNLNHTRLSLQLHYLKAHRQSLSPATTATATAGAKSLTAQLKRLYSVRARPPTLRVWKCRWLTGWRRLVLHAGVGRGLFRSFSSFPLPAFRLEFFIPLLLLLVVDLAAALV